jgi:hypothetical protein
MVLLYNYLLLIRKFEKKEIFAGAKEIPYTR